nr:hypothetical protein [Actinosynnema mirum]
MKRADATSSARSAAPRPVRVDASARRRHSAASSRYAPLSNHRRSSASERAGTSPSSSASGPGPQPAHRCPRKPRPRSTSEPGGWPRSTSPTGPNTPRSARCSNSTRAPPALIRSTAENVTRTIRGPPAAQARGPLRLPLLVVRCAGTLTATSPLPLVHPENTP